MLLSYSKHIIPQYKRVIIFSDYCDVYNAKLMDSHVSLRLFTKSSVDALKFWDKVTRNNLDTLVIFDTARQVNPVDYCTGTYEYGYIENPNERGFGLAITDHPLCITNKCECTKCKEFNTFRRIRQMMAAMVIARSFFKHSSKFESCIMRANKPKAERLKYEYNNL